MNHSRRCPHSHPQLTQKALPKASEHRTSGHAHTCWHPHTDFPTNAFRDPRHPWILADTEAFT